MKLLLLLVFVLAITSQTVRQPKCPARRKFKGCVKPRRTIEEDWNSCNFTRTSKHARGMWGSLGYTAANWGTGAGAVDDDWVNLDQCARTTLYCLGYNKRTWDNA
eukprot:NODE_7523_length_431_cov_16.638158_g7357_i0.p1 GENE.NODE_7523_length_431_cov_16.638158_g7357_i0~~NODE_7523_length_431_cov_16.638158_g7357_i0.p1  ORF type:complete len:122 (-),score=39.71 NODE_7523_length_431_cov_16.638158_g7357_i0:66-380(-)